MWLQNGQRLCLLSPLSQVSAHLIFLITEPFKSLIHFSFLLDSRAASQSVLIQRARPAQRRAPPPVRKIQPQVTMQQYIAARDAHE